MTKAAFCGTFDPVTLGHVDVIQRASKMFDELVVFVSVNSSKNSLYSMEQRLEWLCDISKDLPNVTCMIQKGLVVDACKQVGATVLVRGIRNIVDFEYEKNMAGMNRLIDSSIETICLYTKEEYELCSSTNVKELIKYNQDISTLVPDCVIETLEGK